MTKETGDTHQTDNSPIASHGSAAVNIVVNDKIGRFLIGALVVLIIVLFFTSRTSVSAELKAQDAKDTANAAANEFRMTQFWLQRASLACQNNERMPTIPAALLK